MNFKQRLDQYLAQWYNLSTLQQESLEFVNSFDYNDAALINSPGKFEGEPQYTPYYWNMVLHGAADETIGPIERWTYDIFEVTEDDKDIFPELENVKVISVTSDEFGFVYSDLDPNLAMIL